MMRNALGYTQVDLAGISEVDRSYISGVEREKRSISADKVEQLARAFGVEIYEMFHPDTGETYQRRQVPGSAVERTNDVPKDKAKR
ncbi:helix-turn-helix transcriptional regulator [Sphingobium naphthae]|uniref:helix-turn-helix transcriptional regulator n=1 Tax=Sphingobium naphthae TaxID=1886786 RepID=UPI0037484354